VNLSLQWKQEVNRRVAAHMNRKTPLTGELIAEQEPKPNPDSRAAQLAARVAARYANAPSYNEMLAAEARAAVAAAEAASRAALEAQAAAESVLASIEAASIVEESPRGALHVLRPAAMQERESLASVETEEFFTEPAFELTAEPARMEAAQPAAQPTSQPEILADAREFAIRWEPDMPALRRDPEVRRESQAAEFLDLDRSGWRGAGETGFPDGGIGVVEPALPIYANLIEFPRELIAARRVRPRLAEGPMASAGQDAQLSIFEVDPAHISTEAEVAPAVVETAAPAWAEPEWSRMKLGAEPEEELYHAPEPEPQVLRGATLELASLSRRMLSVAFDVALIGAALVAVATAVMTKSTTLPGLHAAEIGSAVALLGVAAVYHALFFTLGKATPGMRFAQIRLCTFEGQIPTRAQRSARLVAMLISVLPMGLGMMWSIFDDDHLTWHDRLSHTYLRRG
jgi:uncharacterized RDD family membrane protein YckC